MFKCSDCGAYFYEFDEALDHKQWLNHNVSEVKNEI